MKFPLILLLLCLSAGMLQAGEPGVPPARLGTSFSGLDALHASLSPSNPNPAEEGDADSQPGRKNVGTAVLYSLALPGMGELYGGNYSTGKYFTITEGVLLVTLIAFDRYAQWVQDDSRQFAVQHAGVTLSGQSDQFFADIGNYNSVQVYNIAQLRNRDVFSVYNEHSVDAWSWDTDANLLAYRERRITSDQWFNNTRFVVAAIAVNHIISAINAARIVVSSNSHAGETGSIDIRARVLGGITGPDGIQISLTRMF
jgi:hypothetical protein